jgi:hypothetical protein
MNRFGAALALSLIMVPLSAPAATPAPHPSASPKGHGATMHSATKQGPKTLATMPPSRTMHNINKGATMQDRVPHSTPTPQPH